MILNNTLKGAVVRLRLAFPINTIHGLSLATQRLPPIDLVGKPFMEYRTLRYSRTPGE